MSPFTVDAAQAPGLAEIAASLPLSLAPARSGPPQLASVAGSPGWATRARDALDTGASAVVVSSPSPESNAAAALGAAADRVVLEWAFAANAGISAAAEASSPLRTGIVLAETHLRVPRGTDLDAGMLDALTAARRIVGDLSCLRTLHRGSAGWHAAGLVSEGAPFGIAVVVTDAAPAALCLRLLTRDGGLTVVVPPPDTAAPAEVRIVGPDGERLLPTLWETSRRTSWRRAVAIAGGKTTSGDVAEFHRTTALARSLAG
jgi:hypothetical protein